MLFRSVLRQFGVYLVSLGIVLSGVGEVWAAPADTAGKVAGMMAAQMDCVSMAKPMAVTKAPRKSMSKQMDCCVTGAGCTIISWTLPDGAASAPPSQLVHYPLPGDVTRVGISTRPDLPPPIALV